MRGYLRTMLDIIGSLGMSRLLGCRRLGDSARARAKVPND